MQATERKESVKKAFETPPAGAEHNPNPPDPAPGVDDVGDSITRSAEDVAQQEQEPGRRSTGTDGTPANRPVGESTPRDMTGVDPADE